MTRHHPAAIARAWACDSTPADLLAAARLIRNPHTIVFDDWVALKATRPESEITFLSVALYSYTFHRDAKRISELVSLPPTRPRPLGAWDGKAWTPPLYVLEFYEFDTYLNDIALALTAAGETVAFIDHADNALIFRTPADVEAHATGQIVNRYNERIQAQLAAKGAAQLDLFGPH